MLRYMNLGLAGEPAASEQAGCPLRGRACKGCKDVPEAARPTPPALLRLPSPEAPHPAGILLLPPRSVGPRKGHPKRRKRLQLPTCRADHWGTIRQCTWGLLHRHPISVQEARRWPSTWAMQPFSPCSVANPQKVTPSGCIGVGANCGNGTCPKLPDTFWPCFRPP